MTLLSVASIKDDWYFSSYSHRWTRLASMAIHRYGRRFFEIPHAAVYLLIAANFIAYGVCFYSSGTIDIPSELLLRSGAMYPSAMSVPRFNAICARSVDLIEIGGRYSEVQFGLPPFSIALKNSPGVGTVRASTEAAFCSSSGESGESETVDWPGDC